jgi:hypothetical protein
MKKSRVIPAGIGLVLVAAAVLSASLQAAVSSTLHGVVGPDANISLAYDDGSSVGAAAPSSGSYRLLISDLAGDHNFHIVGLGVDIDSGVDAVGSSSFTITLQNNARYQFFCDVHPDSMYGTFTVGAVASSPTPTPTTPVATTPTTSSPAPTVHSTILGALNGSLSPTKASLVLGSKAVTKLRAGKYSLKITDSSAKVAFMLRRKGAAAVAITSAKFTGPRALTLNLKAGIWTYYSSQPGAATHTFTVS